MIFQNMKFNINANMELLNMKKRMEEKNIRNMQNKNDKKLEKKKVPVKKGC